MVSAQKRKQKEVSEFILDERKLAEILGKKIEELDEIVAFFDSIPDDNWELVEDVDFRYVNKRLNKRIYSPSGAHAIAKYVSQHPQFDKRNFFKKLNDWIFNVEGKVRKSLVCHHITVNVDLKDAGMIRVKNGSPYVFRKSCVHLLKTSFAKWNSVTKDIQRSSTPFIPGKHLDEDIDLQDTFFRDDAVSRVGLQLSKELKNKQRRLWCEDFSLEFQNVLKQMLKDEDKRKKRIQNIKNKAKKRDKQRCQVTGASPKDKKRKYDNVKLAAHHLYSASTFPYLADQVDNLITLESTIHEDFHTFMGGTKEPCTVDDFICFLQQRYPEAAERLSLRLNNVKKIFNDPQVPED